MSKQLNTSKNNTPRARSTMAPGAASNLRTPPGFSRQTARASSAGQSHLGYSSIGATSSSTFQPFGGLFQPHPDWTLSPNEFIVSQAATAHTPRHAFFDVPSPDPPTQYLQSGNHNMNDATDEVHEPDEYEDFGEVTAVHRFDPEAPPFLPGFNRQSTLAPSAASKSKLEPSLRRESLLTREKIDRMTKENQELALALEKSRQAEKAAKEKESTLQEKVNTLAQKRIEMVDRARDMEATFHATIKQHAREVASLKAEIAKNRDKELLLQSANDTKVSEYKQKIQSLEAEKTALQREVIKARSELQSELNMTELNDRLHKRLTNAQLEYEQCLEFKDTSLERMQRDLNELNDDKQRLIGHAQRLQDERNQFEIEKNILTRVNEDQEVRISALVSEKAEMTREVKDLSGVNNDYVQTISSLQEQLKSSKAEIAALVKDKDELVNKVNSHDSLNCQTTVPIRTMIITLDRVKSLEMEKNELQKANSAQAKKISSLEKEVHKLNLAHTDLLEECANWRSKVESRHSIGSDTVSLPDEILIANGIQPRGTLDRPMDSDDAEFDDAGIGKENEAPTLDHDDSQAKETASTLAKANPSSSSVHSEHLTGTVDNPIDVDDTDSDEENRLAVPGASAQEGRKQTKKRRALKELECALLSPKKTRSRGNVRSRRCIGR